MKVETPAEQRLFTTVRIEIDPGASVGTGFLISHEWEPGRKGVFLTTNKHMLEGGSRARLLFAAAEGQAGELKEPRVGDRITMTFEGLPGAWTGTQTPTLTLSSC